MTLQPIRVPQLMALTKKRLKASSTIYFDTHYYKFAARTFYVIVFLNFNLHINFNCKMSKTVSFLFFVLKQSFLLLYWHNIMLYINSYIIFIACHY